MACGDDTRRITERQPEQRLAAEVLRERLAGHRGKKLFCIDKLSQFAKSLFADAFDGEQMFEPSKRTIAIAMFDDLSCADSAEMW